MTRSIRSTGFLATGLLAAILTLSACFGSRVPPPPPPATVELQGTADMNAGGNAAVVRFYLLTSDASFRRTPIQDFWRDDAAALGRDLVGTKREVLLYPGDEEALRLELAEEVTFVGVAADLREPDPNEWRVIFPAHELRGQRLIVSVDSDRLNTEIAPAN